MDGQSGRERGDGQSGRERDHSDPAAPAGGSWSARTFSSLRTRNFRLFFVGQLVSNSGNWLTMVALTLLVLHRTNSGVAVGGLAACQFGPIFVLSAWAGLIADRMNKRHLLYVTQSAEMAQSFVLALLAFLPHVPLVLFFVVALAGGVLLAFDNPARRSFVNEMVSVHDVPNAVTLYSAMVNLSRIFGPTIAGALVVSVGYGWCFTVDAISYLVVLVALVMMRERELRPIEVAPKGKGQVRSGIRYVLHVPELRISYLVLVVVGVLSYNFQVVFPLFVEKGLHGSDTDYTLLYAIFSAGAVLGTLVIARRSIVRLRTILVGGAVFGASLLLLGVMPNIYLAYVMAAVVGAASIAYMTSTTAHAQLRAEPQMVGRVLGLQTVLMIGTTPLGGPILGAISDAVGGRTPVLIGGVGALVACAGALLWGKLSGSPLSRVPSPESG